MLQVSNTNVYSNFKKNPSFKKDNRSTLPPKMQQPQMQPMVQPQMQPVVQPQMQPVTQQPMYPQQNAYVMMGEQNKRDKWNKAGVVAQIGLATGIGTFALLQAFKHKNSKAKEIAEEASFRAQEAYYKSITPEKDVVKEAKDLFENLTTALGIKDMCLSDDMNNLLTNALNNINNPADVLRRGGSPMKSFLLYGPPGTGKTTFAKAFSKHIEGAKFTSLDIGKMKDKYHGGTEKNIIELVDSICKHADELDVKYYEELKKVIGEDVVKKGDKIEIAKAIEKAEKEGKKLPVRERVVVFCDEIDSVMMIDTSDGAKLSNDTLNEFKKAFTEKLGKRDNIITVGATNLEIDAKKAMSADGKRLDKPMLDRFQSKIFVGNPNSKQTKNKIIGHYKGCDKVDEVLKTDSKELNILSDFLAEEKHETSFRKIDSILRDVADSTAGSKDNVGLKDYIKTMKSMKEDLHMTDSEINSLASRLGV